ncbi:hypothetical protein FGF1_33070 [Flavobacteriaceae bacterium GF1]
MGQELNGLWKHINYEKNFLSNLRDEIIEFSDTKITRYRFDSEFDFVHHGKEERNQTIIRNWQAKYELLDDNHLKIIYKAEVNGTIVDLPKVYVKLVPTIFEEDKEKLLSIVNSSSYEVYFTHGKTILTFGRTLEIDEIPHLGERNVLGDELRIENIDDYYFVTSYLHGRDRIHAIPIKSIDSETIVLYGISLSDIIFKAIRQTHKY